MREEDGLLRFRVDELARSFRMPSGGAAVLEMQDDELVAGLTMIRTACTGDDATAGKRCGESGTSFDSSPSSTHPPASTGAAA